MTDYDLIYISRIDYFVFVLKSSVTVSADDHNQLCYIRERENNSGSG